MAFSHKPILFTVCTILSALFINNSNAFEQLIVKQINTDGTIISTGYFNNNSNVSINNENRNTCDVIIESNNKNLNINTLSIGNGINNVNFDLPNNSTINIDLLKLQSNIIVNFDYPTHVNEVFIDGPDSKIVITKLFEIGTKQI